MELKGKVLKIGRIKDYGHETNWGRDRVEITKFFMSVETDQGIVNAMVECNAQESEYGYRISKDEPRQRPFIGDTVKFTTRSLRTGNDGTKWASVTFNQTFEITEQNMDARKERDEFIAAKKAERDAEFKAKVDAQKQARADAKKARKQALDALKSDARLPESVRAEITSSFDLTRIISLLRDTTWFTMSEGEGGRKGVYDSMGNLVEDGVPGTGMRRKNGALYDTPASVRASILAKGVKTGLIIETEKGYKATPTGVRLLKTLDTCPECGEMREPIYATSHYTMPTGNGYGWSRTTNLGIHFYCKHELKAAQPTYGSNSGMTFDPVKDIEKKRERIALTLKEAE